MFGTGVAVIIFSMACLTTSPTLSIPLFTCWLLSVLGLIVFPRIRLCDSRGTVTDGGSGRLPLFLLSDKVNSLLECTICFGVSEDVIEDLRVSDASDEVVLYYLRTEVIFMVASRLLATRCIFA